MRTDLGGSCELAQRVRDAARSTTAHAPRASRLPAVRGSLPVCANAQSNGHRPPTSAIAIPKRPGNTPAPAVRPSSGALGVRHASAAWHARMHWRTRRKAAPIRRDTHAQRAGRAARAHGSVRACEWHGERGDRPAPTRPTGCGRAVVVAPACAAIRARARFVRRLGTARRRPLPAGLHAAPSPQAASFGRGGGVTGCGRRTSHPLSTPLGAATRTATARRSAAGGRSARRSDAVKMCAGGCDPCARCCSMASPRTLSPHPHHLQRLPAALCWRWVVLRPLL